LDVTLALVPDAPEHFARDMHAAGFSLRVSDPDFVRRTRVMPFVHDATGMPLDVVLAASGLEDEFLQRAVPFDIGGTRVPIIELSDLIIAKILAGRPNESTTREPSGSCTRVRWTRSGFGTSSSCWKRP
jgi:hypothetical protein